MSEKRSGNRLRKFWDWLEHPLRVRHLLEWAGWWEGFVSVAAGFGTFLWAGFNGLAPVEQFAIALAVALLIIPGAFTLIIYCLRNTAKTTIYDARELKWVNPRGRKRARVIVTLAVVLVAIAIYGYHQIANNAPVMANRLIASLDSRVSFLDSTKCECTGVIFIATISNVGYPPQTPITHWALGLTLSNGKVFPLAAPSPFPDETSITAKDRNPTIPNTVFRSDELLTDRAYSPIALNDHRSGVLLFLLHGVKESDIRPYIAGSKILLLYSGIDGHPEATMFPLDSKSGPAYSARIPGLKSGTDWEDMLRKYNKSVK